MLSKRLLIAARRTLRRGAHFIRRVFLFAASVLMVSLVLECASRLMHFGVRPMLPFVTDLGLAPRLPPNFRSTIRFPGRDSFEVCTDSIGLRQARCDDSDAPIRTLIAGDSQVLGWGFSFSNTLAARVAQHFGVSLADVRILAAGGADVESLRPWASELTKQAPKSRVETKIVSVNLGNDLDEMYFDRAMGRVQYLKSAFEWLNSHSFLMLDYTIFKRIVLGEPWGLPPGTNPVVFALDDGERTQLALAVAEAVKKLVAALPPSDRTVIAIFPADYQVDVRQFNKYQKFYASESQFRIWRAQAPEAARRLDEIESILRATLAKSGMATVSVKDTLKGTDTELMIDSASHHLTIEGQNLVSKAIVDTLERRAMTHVD